LARTSRKVPTAANNGGIWRATTQELTQDFAAEIGEELQ